jgi:hypothetical protein
VYQLNTQATGEEWLVLIEGDAPVRVLMRPVGPSAVTAAGAALSQATHPVEDFAKDAGFDAYCRELCRRAIIAWEGVGQHDAPAPLTRENIDALLSDSRLLARLQRLYVYPYLIREQEKNASAPSSAGTSPAKTGAKGTAAAARNGAKPARTSSAPRRPRKAKPSGK